MMSMPPSGVYQSRMQNDRSSLQLRAYAREEYGSEAGWIHALVRSRSVPLRTRLRRWIRTRSQRQKRRAPAATPLATVSASPSESRLAASACPHVVADDLGAAGGAQFLQCTACGEVLVVQAGRTWRVAGLPGAASPPAASVADLMLTGTDELAGR